MDSDSPDGQDTQDPLPRLDHAGGVAGLLWSQVVWTAAAGALLVAVAMALGGSTIAVAVALVWAALLGAGGLAVARLERRRPADTRGRARATEVKESLPALLGETAPRVGAPLPAALQAPQGLPALQSLATRLAEQAKVGLRAPAAAVLIPRGRRLVAAGSAGDWALARRLQHEATRSDGDPLPLLPAQADGDPPEFPLDEHLPRLLGLYGRAVPVERWRALEDAPPPLLPLVALADRGTGVAVALRHRQRLAGLWVVARRPAGELYSDSELRTFEQLARQAGPELARALARTYEEEQE